MYDSNNESIFIDQQAKNCRTEVLCRLYGMDFNLIPISGKHPPCIEWKPFQTQRVTPEEAMKGVFGYTCGNDVTARDQQRAESQWFRGKAFDSSCPLGPAISTDVDPSDLRLRCLVDGEVRQDGTTADLVVDVATLVSQISQIVTLLPSDVILTGTPAGVGPIEAGQRVSVEIDGIGTLENPVVDRMAVSG
jgi:2-keto-4-pentenoate hydratase/2-oxohepta-3-ene-1,7-dioic acid hydratase in catechol pathway